MELGPVGVWWSGSWKVDVDPEIDAASELESMGYGAIWSSGGFDRGLSRRFGRLLESTSHLVVASGIVNVWTSGPQEVAEAVAGLEAEHPGRFLLGLGVSHQVLIEAYANPYDRMVGYLDALDSSVPTVPRDRRVLAALRPRMLELAADRSGGAHPYFVPAEHSSRARQILGPDALLCPELTVVLETDASRARERARAFAAGYLAMPNYANNLRWLGYGDADVSGAGSDRLIDAVIAWGDAESIARRVREHHEAGADHVCLQVTGAGEGFPLEQFRELCSALSLG
ncbi:MAG TPA: LLM class F420-dependent oxidoreductase [Acidimicrobiales bacterium]|nr:LLM class F420-dependent oxidoreductase [Acidimicrobiales bacterium]